MYRNNVVKEISKKNKKERVYPGEFGLKQDFDNFWKNINFTDEAHYDPSEEPVERSLKGRR